MNRPRIREFRERLARWVAPKGIRFGDGQGRVRVYVKDDKLVALNGERHFSINLATANQELSGTYALVGDESVVTFRPDGTYTKHIYADLPRA